MVSVTDSYIQLQREKLLCYQKDRVVKFWFSSKGKAREAMEGVVLAKV